MGVIFSYFYKKVPIHNVSIHDTEINSVPDNMSDISFNSEDMEEYHEEIE